MVYTGWKFEHSVVLGIWVMRSGAWQKVTQVQGICNVQESSGGVKTRAYTYSGTLQLGAGIQSFGVTIDSVDSGAVGSSATLDDIVSIKWTAQGAGTGVRTALPNGVSTTITVRPR